MDAYWAEVSRTVAEGDFEGYSAVYHEDCVLVTTSGSEPISAALERWAKDFENTEAGTESSVDFRFSMRVSDATTAHETGIFRLSTKSPSGEVDVRHRHFEALLLKKGGWLMLMERQMEPATVEEWDALR